EAVDAPVRGLLPDEALHLVVEAGLLFGRQGLVAVAHRVDEELLADREAHRQRVEEGGAKRIAGAPVARHRGLEVDQQAADGEGRHASLPESRVNSSSGTASAAAMRRKVRSAPTRLPLSIWLT